LGRITSVANLETVSAMAASTSERCEMGVGGISEMSMWSLRRVAVVDRGRATLLEGVGEQLA
jgi:hypothetical protein